MFQSEEVTTLNVSPHLNAFSDLGETVTDLLEEGGCTEQRRNDPTLRTEFKHVVRHPSAYLYTWKKPFLKACFLDSSWNLGRTN